MNVDRLGGFSDDVITIMVLELKVLHQPSLMGWRKHIT
jgi:uncharacterized membrane protein